MNGPLDARANDVYLARAVWFLGLIARQAQPQPDGTAIVVLPARYLDAFRELTGIEIETAPEAGGDPEPATAPSPASGPSRYLAACGAPHCVRDVWETDVYGSPCPVCGNTDGNVYDRIDGILAEGDEVFGPVIHRYSRADALADGVLVDATVLGAEAGFRYPVALTAAAWQLAVAWSDDEPGVRFERGRLWDVVHMAAQAVRDAVGSTHVLFGLAVVPHGQRSPRHVTLLYACGLGDDGQPAVTIMVPDEAPS